MSQHGWGGMNLTKQLYTDRPEVSSLRQMPYFPAVGLGPLHPKETVVNPYAKVLGKRNPLSVAASTPARIVRLIRDSPRSS